MTGGGGGWTTSNTGRAFRIIGACGWERFGGAGGGVTATRGAAPRGKEPAGHFDMRDRRQVSWIARAGGLTAPLERKGSDPLIRMSPRRTRIPRCEAHGDTPAALGTAGGVETAVTETLKTRLNEGRFGTQKAGRFAKPVRGWSAKVAGTRSPRSQQTRHFKGRPGSGHVWRCVHRGVVHHPPERSRNFRAHRVSPRVQLNESSEVHGLHPRLRGHNLAGRTRWSMVRGWSSQGPARPCGNKIIRGFASIPRVDVAKTQRGSPARLRRQGKEKGSSCAQRAPRPKRFRWSNDPFYGSQLVPQL